MRLWPIRFVAFTVMPAVALACTKTIIEGGIRPPAGMTALVGNNQTGQPGQALLVPPTVRVVSSDGQPVGNVTVIFASPSGGSILDPTPRTDANGVASAGRWVLGPLPGQQLLSASVPGVASVTFVASAVAPPGVSPDRILIGFRPYGVSVSPSGVVYTSQLDGRSVTRAQVGATAAISVVGVGDVPTDVTFDPSGSVALVTNQFDPSVGIIDVASGRETSVIPALATTFRVLVAANGQRAYATETAGRLLVIDLATRSLATTVQIPNDANGLAFGAGDTLLYVTSMRGSVAAINLKTNTVARTWTLAGVLQDVAVSPDGSTLYIAHEESGGTIDVVNALTGAVTARFTLGGAGVFGLKLAPDGRSLYATQPSAGQVLVLDRTNGQVLRTFSVGGIPRRIAFDRGTGRAFVSNEAGWLDFLPLP